jgi:predicted MFS family arabinose efflux permease
VFTLIGLGASELVGGFIGGYILDKTSPRVGLAYILVMTIIGFIILIVYNEIHAYSVLAYFVTIMWGFHDSALNTFVSSMIGF